MMPFFSVVMTTHNAAVTISKTLESVIDQTFTDFEIIIVDDASADQTIDIVKKILNRCSVKNRIISLEMNIGVSEARNIGVKDSVGSYVAFIDDDDIWDVSKLAVQHTIIKKNTDIYWLFSNYFVMNEQYSKVSVRRRKKGEYDFSRLVNCGNPVGLLTVFIKRNILLEHPFKNIPHEDYDLWLELGKEGYKGFLYEGYLASYMLRSDSLSSNKWKAMLWTYSLYKKYTGKNFRSFLLTIKYIYNAFSRFQRRVDQ